MLEGMYSAAAGMAAQQQKLDSVATDLANANTTGYKHVRTAFRDLIYAHDQRNVDSDVEIGTGAVMSTIGRSMTQGSFQNTGEPLDVGIGGQGFIAVKDTQGKAAMTRDGNLRINEKNQLTTHDGQLLDPSITIPAGTDTHDIHIGTDGNVQVAGKTVGTIRMVNVAAPSLLQGGENNLFYATKGSGAPRTAGADTTLNQGVLEASNVDMGEAMTSMIEAQRGYELASKAINFQDQMAEIANQVKQR